MIMNNAFPLWRLSAISHTNISALQDIVQALQENEHVQTVVPIKENGEEIGYVVTLSSGKTLTIYHPVNDSGNVPSGNAAPSIGVKKDSDGMYYWTFGGEWLTDNTGNRVKAVGTDGKDGKDGKDGIDGITPKLKIENDYWYVSYDNGLTWKRLSSVMSSSGSGNSSNADSFFRDVTLSEKYMIFTLADGTIVRIPLFIKPEIVFDNNGTLAPVKRREEITVKYTIANATESTLVTASSDGIYRVKVRPSSASAGEILITAPDIYTDGYINVMVSDGNGYSDLTVINFYEKQMNFSKGYNYNVSEAGGTLTVPFKTNFDYVAKVTSGSSWISLADTKSAVMRDENISLVVSQNTSFAARNGVVTLYAVNNPDEVYCEINVNQASAYFSMSQSVFIAEATEGDSEVSVSSSLGLSVKTDDLPEWLAVTVQQGATSGSYTLALSLSRNDGEDKRSAVVTLYSEDGKTRLGEMNVLQVSDVVAGEKDMVFRVRAAISNGFTCSVPLSGTVDCYVDWGDGTIEHVTASCPTHLYSGLNEPKDFIVRVSGKVTELYASSQVVSSLMAVVQWGNTGLTRMSSAFHGCTRLESVPADDAFSFMAVKSFVRAFSGCCSLTSIPEGLFANCPNVTSFEHTFSGCSSLTSIPEGLFANCPNVTSFECTFSDCSSLTSIPEGLFADCPNVTSFKCTFVGCSSLTSIPEGFFNCPNVADFCATFYGCTGLTSLPADLFSNCPNVKRFGYDCTYRSTSGTFSDCTGLTSLPEGLFSNCPNVTNFCDTFSGCTGLTSLPAALFSNCPNVTNFSHTFYRCTGLTSVPVSIFSAHHRVTSFSDVFSGLKLSALQESPYSIIDGVKYHLYERENNPDWFVSPSGGDAFYGGANNWTDWDQMPEAWK